MKNNCSTTLVLVIIEIILLLNVPRTAIAQKSPGAKNIVQAGYASTQIHEARFIIINGIEQWITINGERSKPVILFLHGGPGSTMSPYSKALYGAWEKDFIIVQWDQRGAGKTFGKYAPAELDPAFLKSLPLTIDQMTADGIQLSEYLGNYLGKQKIILFGTSWGSILGALMAVKRPGLFYAYVGHSQIVNPSANLISAYQRVYELAKQNGDSASIETLGIIGKPPYDSAKTMGRLMRIIKLYERKNSVAAPDAMWKMEPSYANAKDEQNRADGDDYSFVNYAGDKQLEIKPIMSTVNLLNDGINFKIPVFLIQGEQDILTSKEITRDYFDRVNAPHKEYILLPKTAHGFNQSVIDTQYKIFKSIRCL